MPANDQTNQPASGEQNTSKPYALDQYSVQPQQQESDSPYYKPAAPSISLPKGGGALKGIDEKFEVNAVNGTAGLSIALPLSPGRAGFTPALSLSYSSGSGNSAFGLGWDLGLPDIRRKTDKRLPRYNDTEESDVFLLAGAEDLVPELDEQERRVVITDGAYRIRRYRPRIEGLFARIEYITKTGAPGSWWRVTTKDNVTTWYGLDASARIADPEYAYKIYRWLPQLVTDHKGNVQRYRYKAEDLANVTPAVFEQNRLNGNAPFANTYLKKVSYGNRQPWLLEATDNVWQPALPEAEWLFEAVFDYGDHPGSIPAYAPSAAWTCRTDAFSDYRSGFEIRTWRRCSRVLMFHHFDDLEQGLPTLVRALELRYRHDDSPGAITECDFIISATQRGYTNLNGTIISKALPALELDYIPLEWDTSIHKVAATDFQGAPQGLTGPYQWTDFDGEGISGILSEQAGGWFYKHNLGDAHFMSPEYIAEKPSFNGLGAGALQWQDLDADGRRQVVSDVPVKGYWELDGPDAYTEYERHWLPFRNFDKQVNIDWNSPFTRMLDLDGDGRADVLITEDQAWSWWANEGKKGFDYGGRTPRVTDEEKGPVLLHRDPVQSIFLADMSADGLTDLVRIRNGEVCYWPNTGYGRFGAKVTMAGAPLFQHPDIYNPIYLNLADISGTGAADLVYTGRNRLMAWINQSGNGFGAGQEINPLPGTDAYSKIAVLDFLGNGTGCIVWSSPLPQHATAPIQYIDLMGGRKPYLLEKYRNGMGKEVRLSYKSSTRYYLDDKLQGIRWATKLPFPVHCLSSVETEDSVSQTVYAQAYSYRHGYYDQEEREFRGFGYVETLDADTAVAGVASNLDQPPVLTKTWYHTGAWIREQSLLDRFQQEYFPVEGWDDLTVIASFPPGLNAQEQREAYRALKGSVLRQEVYARDSSSKADVPYSVQATAYTIKKIQALGPNRHAAFLNLQQQSLSFSCEREAADPRLLQQFTLATDAYGNVTESAEVAYKRKTLPVGLPPEVAAAQNITHVTYNQQDYTNDILDSTLHYRLPQAWAGKGYEVHIPPPEGDLYTLDELKTLIAATAAPVTGQRRLLSHTQARFLKNDTLAPLAAGLQQSLGLPYESYTLAYTPETILQQYNSDSTRLTEAMLEAGGYLDLEGNDHYWLPSGTVLYSATPKADFYSPLAYSDPWGNGTLVTYANNYYVLPESITDAKGNVTTVEDYDWRLLQPLKLKDANDNISEVLYDALGMPVAMALKGKDNPLAPEGDTLSNLLPDDPDDLILQAAFWADPDSAAADLLQGATWRCVYDLEAQPARVGMIARTKHAVDPEPVETIIRLSYSDGMGRVLMHKAQCAPTTENGSKQWIGSGRTVYNNKGSVVLQYEPYFSATHNCDTAEQAAQQGVSPKLYYDPLNRNFRTDLPDGTFTKTEWTAWEQEIWDNNDTVLESTWYTARIGGAMGTEAQQAAQKAAAHANTPTLIHTDTLGRGFYTIQLLVAEPVEAIHSYENLNIQGNRLSVVDGRELIPLTYSYNMLQAPCRQISLDSGTQRTVLDVAGQPLYAWDAEDRRTEMVYDELRRPEQRITDTKVLEVYVYGEGQTNDKVHNLRGQLYKIYDGAGLIEISSYDFKGNALAQIRTYTEDGTHHPDWTNINSIILESATHTTATTYDALSRPVTGTTPDNGITSYTYDRGGLLKTLYIDNVHSLDSNIINAITYDAKGQRQKIQYENGATTVYAYDAFTFRIRNIKTTRHSDSKMLQDLYYWYDPVGNITLQKDLAQETVYFDGTVAEPHNDYTYDALYRLIQAKGRELAGNNAAPTYNDSSRTGITPIPISASDTGKMRRYIQYYTYDAVGNLAEMQHTVSGSAGSWTRTYTTDEISNQLLQTVVGSGSPENYTYDPRGNITNGFTHLQSLSYNAENRLERVVLTGTRTAYYQYDAQGQRVRKTIIDTNTNIKEIRKYVGEWELYRKFTGSSLTIARETLHVNDDTGRIALVDTRTVGTGTEPSQLLRYQFSNHLGSATLELDEVAAIISYEEYYPYGSTSFQSGRTLAEVSLKRYRYTGKERDEESGLYYHGARYYIPWLARWTACDPLESKYAGVSPYNYGNCNPVIFNDPTGMSGEEGRTHNGKPVQYGNMDTDRGVMNFTKGYNPSTDKFEIIAAEFAQDNIVVGQAMDKGVFSLDANLQGGRWLDIRGLKADTYEFTDEGFSDPYNYGAAIINTLGAVWNSVVGVGDAVINNVGLVDDAYRSISETITAEIDYFQNTSAEQKWSDIKSVVSNPHLYTNLVAFGLTMKATIPTKSAVAYEFKNVTTTVEAAKGITRSLDDLSSLKGATWDEAKSLIPKDWISGPMKKGEGIKFVNPAKKGEQILLEKGWPGAKDPLHAGPYMKISRDGQITRIPLQGNPTLK